MPRPAEAEGVTAVGAPQPPHTDPGAPQLTLADVRTRAAELGKIGDVWVVTSVSAHWQWAELNGVFGDLGDALAEVEAAVSRQRRQHPDAEATIREDPAGAWDISVARVVVQLMPASVIRPGHGR